MNPLFPADSRTINYAAWGLVLIVLVHLCSLPLRPGSEVRRLIGVARKSAACRAAWSEYEGCDRFVTSSVGAGNVLLKTTGYTNATPADEHLLSFFYYRANYALCPRRMYIGPTDTVINGGWGILRMQFNPGQNWLREHDVRLLLTADGGGENKGRLVLTATPCDTGLEKKPGGSLPATPASGTGGK